jgi:cob(I)alamin adenosyltransferase
MSFITVARTIVQFENQKDTLQYIQDALYHIKNNYKDKYSYTFKNQELILILS